ncbi:MAG: gliding motility-associated C-terminal domain-containing protein [Bacteroidales bacterium]|jgi:gliding motility-associated-like protein|nr:gliding motility-associated C-terminal domain-containing protein [Bacteroidales bacterium]
MNNDFDKHIQELLQSYGEQPAADCWDKIESQLEATQATNTDSGSSSASSGNGSSLSHFVGTVTGKVVSAMATVAAVGGIISLVAVLSTDTDTEKQSQPPTTIAETQQNTPASDKNEVKMIEVDIVYSKPENENTIDTPHVHEHTVIIIHPENENIAPIQTPHHLSTTAEHHPSTDNSVKQEATPKADPKPQPPSIVKEPQKEQTTDIKEAHPQPDFEHENTQDLSHQPEVRIPNIFTPNGDSFNEYFIIEGIDQFPETHLTVFRQNGKIIYDKTNYQNDWNADNIPDGVYYYVFKFVYQGEQFMRNGSITIKRL